MTLRRLRQKMGDAIRALEAQQVPVLKPGEDRYRKSIATSNLVFRFCRPDCVVQPQSVAHVQAIVREAKARSLKLTIKGNGHSYAGHSTAMSGISLDLRSMKTAQLDMNPVDPMVTMDAGCQWGDVYEKLIIGGHDRYIINGGRCPTVGVSGFILGGGLGPFTRSFGMGADTLAEATLVTADGSLVTVSESDPPSSSKGRLFWALRGAGGGNFGIVVQMKLRVKKLANPRGMVVAGRYQWFPNDGITDDLVATMNTFYATPWPNKMTIDTTWICDLRDNSNTGGVRFNISFDGTKFEYNNIIKRYVAHPELQRQLKRRALPEPSTRYLYETLVSQWLEETQRAYPTNKTYELYSSFVFDNSSPSALADITAAIRTLMTQFRVDFKGEKVNFLVTWIHSGGEASRKVPNETAYFWRQAVFHTYVTIEWVDKWMEEDMRDFLASVKQKLRPLSLNAEAAFVNFPDRDFPGKTHERAYWGDNKEELRQVKKMWDPEGFFNWTQGVRRPEDPDEDEAWGEENQTDKLASEQWGKWSKTTEPVDLAEEFNDLGDLGFDEDEE
ncbi:FAD binding domain-protein [Podospora conica]|nr:FAD binding domain-protein [Schizothecium conicum]